MNFKHINNSIGLYIHIPVCKKKCSYCDFYSETNLSNNKIEILIEQIILQTDYITDLIGNPHLSTVYIGGGTPSFINHKNLNKLLCYLRKKHSTSLEIERTIEANPETLNRNFLDICNGNEITRISLGIQSFNSRLLKVLGRNALNEDNLRAVSLLNKFWNKDFNLDIIAGIPGQTFEELKDDLKRIIDSGAVHISMYSLTVSEKTQLYYKIRQGEIIQDSKDYQDELWLNACEYLKDNGYNQYEISNFCIPGKECKHNLIYWNMDPYVGIGPGAVSTIPGGQTGIMRISNNANLGKYLIDYKNSNITEEISKEDFLFENLMMGFRKKQGINKEVFKKRFGYGLNYFLGSLFNGWMEKSYLEENEDFYHLTEKGRLILNALLLDVHGNLKNTETVNWP